MNQTYNLRLPRINVLANQMIAFKTRVKSKATPKTGGLSVRTARTREDLEMAFGLLQRRYEESGLAKSSGNKMRIMPYHLFPKTQVFVASDAGRVVGTITLIRETVHSLPMATTYPRAIANLALETTQFGEITSLAVDPAYKSRGEVYAQLTRLLAFFARAQSLEYIVAVVHPRHAKFYRHAMGFEVVGEEKSYAAVEGNPGVAVVGSVIDTSRFRKRWRDHYFVGDFSSKELRPNPIIGRQNKFFAAILGQQQQPAVGGLKQVRA